MRILAASQSCVVDSNQKLFIELSKIADVEVELLIPSKWKSEYDGALMVTSVPEKSSVSFRLLPVGVRGNNSLHFYLRMPIKQLRLFSPDIVYSTMEPWSLSNFQLLILSWITGAKFFFHTNQNLLKYYPPPFNWLERIAYQHCEVGLAYSKEASEKLYQKGFTGRCAIVPYAIDSEDYFYGKEEDLRRSIGVEGFFVVGYMGRLVYEKGIDTLIRAIKSVNGEIEKIKLLIVGTGNEERRLRDLVRELKLEDVVHFVGKVPHVLSPQYMRCIDLLVLPSRTTARWKEQFGRVLIEAMAQRIPVIGSDSGEIPNLIHFTGGGLVFHEDDVEDLSAQLIKLISDSELRSRCCVMGELAARKYFTFSSVASKLHRIFKGALVEEYNECQH